MRKREWRVCVNQPFMNCQYIYPIQQNKVKSLLEDITDGINQIKRVIVFGSSVTEFCHAGSDVDIYVETDNNGALIKQDHPFEYDLWTNHTADERLKKEILSKGVVVYEQNSAR